MGSSVRVTGRAEDEISGMIGLARIDLDRLRSALWSRRKILLKTKAHIYEALMRPILHYSCET